VNERVGSVGHSLGPAGADLTTLDLILTAACNLRCTYCYQNAKKNRRMSWSVAQRALDALLASEEDVLAINFFGGEPMTEFDLIRRSVQYFEERKETSRTCYYGVSTNGSFLGPDEASFLAEYRFDTQISFDGVADAQRFRGDGTFEIVIDGVRSLRERYSEYFQQCVSVGTTLLPSTVKHLPDTVELLLHEGVQNFSVTPVGERVVSWRIADIDRLDDVFDEVLAILLAHYRVDGVVPFSAFRSATPRRTRPRSVRMCGVGSHRRVTVDVDGKVHRCVVFADSYQNNANPMLSSELGRLRLGELGSEDARERLGTFQETVDQSVLFTRKEEKYSSYGKCSDCECFDECSICPVSIGYSPTNQDPRRVPDFACAYNLISNKYRELFWEAVG